MNVKLSLSTDESILKLEAETLVMKATDVELLISHLAERRQHMTPQVSQLELIQPDSHQAIDAMMPNFDLALLPQNPPLAVLTIAYEGLGCRTAALSREQSLQLARRLLALFEESPLHSSGSEVDTALHLPPKPLASRELD